RSKARCEVLSAFDLECTSVTLPTSFVPFGKSVPSGSLALLVVLTSTSSPTLAFFTSIRLVSSAETGAAAAVGWPDWAGALIGLPVCPCNASEKIAIGTSERYFIIISSSSSLSCAHADHELPHTFILTILPALFVASLRPFP